MKIPILICIVFVSSLGTDNAHLASAHNKEVQQFTEECVKETGVKREVVAEANAGQFTEDEGLKKFILCYFQKYGLLSSDGKLNTEVALSKVPEDLDKVAAEKHFNKYKNESGKNSADTAFQIYKCYHKVTK